MGSLSRSQVEYQQPLNWERWTWRTQLGRWASMCVFNQYLGNGVRWESEIGGCREPFPAPFLKHIDFVIDACSREQNREGWSDLSRRRRGSFSGELHREVPNELNRNFVYASLVRNNISKDSQTK